MQKSVISKTIKINASKLPPDVEFIENEIIKSGLEPLIIFLFNQF